MICLECSKAGREQAAVGICKNCFGGFCEAHLANAASASTFAAYDCRHPAPDALAAEPAEIARRRS